MTIIKIHQIYYRISHTKNQGFENVVVFSSGQLWSLLSLRWFYRFSKIRKIREGMSSAQIKHLQCTAWKWCEMQKGHPISKIVTCRDASNNISVRIHPANHMKWPGNKPKNYPKLGKHLRGTGLAMNGSVLSGFLWTTWIFQIIGKNQKTFHKNFVTKS